MPIPAPDARTDAVRHVRLGSVEAVAAWRHRWDALARSLDALVFASPAWVEAWATVLEPDAELELLVAGDDDLTGLLPLATRRQRLHPRIGLSVRHLTIAGAGRGAADHLGPLAADDPTAAALLAAAVEAAAGRPIVLPNLAPDPARLVERATGRPPTSTTPVPGIDLRPVADASELWNRKLVKNLRRADRLLEEAGYQSVWERIDRDNGGRLEHHARLHARRWSRDGRSGLFDPERQRFLVELGDRLRAPDGVWHQLVEGPAGPIGSSIVLAYGRTVCTYSTGRDPDFSGFSLGAVLHARAIRRAVADGAVRYEFLRGLGPHKERLGGVPVEDRSYVLGRGPGAAALRAREHHIVRRDRPAGRPEPTEQDQ